MLRGFFYFMSRLASAMRTSRTTPLKTVLLAALLNLGVWAALANAAELAPAERDSLERIRDAAMQSDWGYQRLADLSDLIGARLAGSPAAEAAVTQVSQALRSAGISVRLEPVQVPHWVRGVEEARLVDYPGKPAGVTQKIAANRPWEALLRPPQMALKQRFWWCATSRS